MIVAPGHLADNVLHFARLLRAAGLPLGSDRVLLALQALPLAGVASRGDLHAALRGCLLDRAEHRALFDAAFALFWRAPAAPAPLPVPTGAPSIAQRLADALAQLDTDATTASAERAPRPQRPAWTASERLRKTDFDGMTAAEWAAARTLLAQLRPFLAQQRTRRFAPAHAGPRLDLRALLRASARRGGEIAELPRRVRRTRPEPVVALVDISGSMSRYSRMFLHFLHALGAHPALRLRAFTFGTRLTEITRPLRARAADDALAAVVRAVDDWSGGTRIAQALRAFNRGPARFCAAGATVLLVTDGLEHAELDALAAETARLARGCRRLVWLNPLLRYASFEPRARGVQAMLPHVHAFLPVHNLDSLHALAARLAAAGAR